jgi:hypothetical protein
MHYTRSIYDPIFAVTFGENNVGVKVKYSENYTSHRTVYEEELRVERNTKQCS